MAGYNIVEHTDFVETVIQRGVEWTKRSTTLQPRSRSRTFSDDHIGGRTFCWCTSKLMRCIPVYSVSCRLLGWTTSILTRCKVYPLDLPGFGASDEVGDASKSGERSKLFRVFVGPIDSCSVAPIERLYKITTRSEHE